VQVDCIGKVEQSMVVIAGDIFELWRAARREKFEMLFKEKYKGRRRVSSKIWSFAIRAKGPGSSSIIESY
jgi:hypothetical protein